MQNNDAIRIDFEKNFAASYQSCQMELGRLSDSSYISPYTQTAWDAYLAGLAAANKRIAQLESTLIDVQNYGQKRIAELEQLIPLVKEVMSNHRDPQSGEYNECESSPCMWCDLAQKVVDAAREEEGK